MLTTKIPTSLLVTLLFIQYLIVNCQTNDDSTEFCTKEPSYSCDDNLFPTEDRIIIKHANNTIPEIIYEKNYVDFQLKFDENVRKFRLFACGCQPSEQVPEDLSLIHI